MKAVEVNYYRQPIVTIMHDNVVEVERTHKASREFKCLCCGRQWTENLNSPQVINAEIENSLDAYFENIVPCS